MKAKYTIIFLLCVLALAASEYGFLVELSSHQRPIVLLLTSFIAIIAVIAIFLSYKRLGKQA